MFTIISPKIHHWANRLLQIVVVALFLCSCSSTKYIPENEFLLGKVKVNSTTDVPVLSDLLPYVRINSNTKWQETVSYKLKGRKLSAKDSLRWMSKAYKKWGEKAIFYDKQQADNLCNVLQSFMNNSGYLKANIAYSTKERGKIMDLLYTINPGNLYFVRNVSYEIADSAVNSLLEDNDMFSRGLKGGTPFSVEVLEKERQRITSYLRNNGYYKFNKEFIHFRCDTTKDSQMIDVAFILDLFQANSDDSPSPHKRYTMNNITFTLPADKSKAIRHSVLENNMMLKSGDFFEEQKLQQSFNNFSRLHAIKYTNIKIEELIDSAALNAHVDIKTNKSSSISFLPEGTNTAGNLGAAATITYENKNAFHGSETFSLQLRAAFEAITGLEGYKNKDYEEYSIESKLSFPRLLIPFVSPKDRIHVNATSELALSYSLQNRPEFHRRVLSTAWRYRWKSNYRNISYKFDLIDLNYIYMPWISSTFKHQYLDNVTSRNAILRYNYEDLFITKIGFSLSYSNNRQALRASVETSGNLLNMASRAFHSEKNSQQQFTLFKIAFAQYAKADLDYTYGLPLGKHDAFVMHVGFGIAYPYGNSKILPFEKRYFSGGANSVRGWNVRGLGPGKFYRSDGGIDFINQTGDMKIDLNIEYRLKLFWKFNGAAFIDAGNIWTLRHYEEQEGGQFRFDTFYKQMAVAYGVGLRLNFDYFILRFDMGMKAINPSYNTNKEHYPLIHPNLDRDFTFHFAVGLPF